MPCNTEIGREKFSATWTAEEIAIMEAEIKIAIAKAELKVARMANTRGWSRDYFAKMKAKAVEEARLKAHEDAHDRHFLRQINESLSANKEAVIHGRQ